MPTSTLQTVEQILERAAVSASKSYILGMLVKAVPFFGLSWVNPVVAWILGYILGKVGMAAIVEAGDIFIQLDTAAQASGAQQSAAALQAILNNPNSTAKEIADAQKAMDDSYSSLINFNI
jgi:ferritin-like metal-binding protein YciE